MTPNAENKADVITLSPAAQRAVEEIMVRSGATTIQEALRRAISDELFLLRHRAAGWSIKLQTGQMERDVRWLESNLHSTRPEVGRSQHSANNLES